MTSILSRALVPVLLMTVAGTAHGQMESPWDVSPGPYHPSAHPRAPVDVRAEVFAPQQAPPAKAAFQHSSHSPGTPVSRPSAFAYPRTGGAVATPWNEAGEAPPSTEYPVAPHHVALPTLAAPESAAGVPEHRPLPFPAAPSQGSPDHASGTTSSFHGHRPPPPPADGHGKLAESAFGCDGCGQPACVCRSPWFAAVGALILTRECGDHHHFSIDSGSEELLNDARDVNMEWSGGFEVRFGRYFNSGQHAIEVVYWGLFPDREVSFVTASQVDGTLDALGNWVNLSYAGATADFTASAAELHSLFRESEMHNVELNLLQFCGSCGHACDGQRLNYHWLAGTRFFRFHDHLTFATDAADRQLTGAAPELYYDIDMDNDLIGVQLGAQGDYALTRSLTGTFAVKGGVFHNRISHYHAIEGALGVATIEDPGGPNHGRDFRVDNEKDDVAFLGELKLGLAYQFHPRWSATFGYRLLAISGVALPTEQVARDFRLLQEVEQIDANSSLILHGAYLGIESSW